MRLSGYMEKKEDEKVDESRGAETTSEGSCYLMARAR